MSKLKLSIALSIGLLAPGIASAEADASAAIEKNLEQTRTLIEESSAAKQIEKSGSPEALAMRDKARALYQRALEARKNGRDDQVIVLTNEAKATMFKGVRMAKPDEVLHGKREEDFKNRKASVDALLEALKRIAAEKNKQAESKKVEDQVVGLIAEGEKLYKADQLVEGKDRLVQANQLLKVAIEGLRGGDTLVRSLNFATKEEEFRYEAGRNETHKVLVEVMALPKAKSNPRMLEKVEEYVRGANDLRLQAEERAKSGKYDEGVDLMEQATKELIKAIRMAGIFIPG